MKTVIISFAFFLLVVSGCSNESNLTKSDENNFNYELEFQFNTHHKPNSLSIDDESQFIYILSGQFHSVDNNLKILKFSHDGNLLATVVDFSNYSSGLHPKYLPTDITLDDENNFCVLTIPYTKAENDEYWEACNGFSILIHNPNGELIKELDFSNNNLAFKPEAITFKNNLFYVTNSYSLFKISKATEQISEISLPKILDDTFPENLISDLAINGDNNIWFVGQTTDDPTVATNYILKMDSECNQLFRFNSINELPILHAALSQPAIKIDENGIVYLTTFYCRTLEIYNPSGELFTDYNFVKEINESVLPIDLEIDKNKNIYVLDHWNNTVYCLSRKRN